ncbi:hypothetical protein [Piscirickettsia litoralis]|nr:hypothetical protein [Piscirickettsia litoralis]
MNKDHTFTFKVMSLIILLLFLEPSYATTAPSSFSDMAADWEVTFKKY